MKFKITILILVLFITSNIYGQNKYQPSWESIDSRPVPQWFQDAKFGIFIHWGVYSVPSYVYINREGSVYDCYAEWYEVLEMSKKGRNRDFHNRVYGKDFEYRQFAPMFKAELWNPDKWANLFKDAGAKYVILTSKHHDGFALWPSTSPYSKNWNAVDVGPKRDLVGDLSKAVRDKGLKMGLYFSLIEWESTPTDRPENINGYYLPPAVVDKYKIPADKMITDHIIPQMKELVMKYQPSILYPDGDWDEGYERLQSREFLSWLYNNAPNKEEVAVNDRWGKVRGEHGGYYSREYADTDDLTNEHPWEEIQGMGYSFGYNRNEDIHDYRSSEELVHLLVNTVGRGGNLCLNVGPTADGRIPVIMEQRLLDIGKWLEVNGEGIYGTKAWHNPAEFKKPVALKEDKKEKSAAEAAETSTGRSVFYTIKGEDLYVLSTKWPEKAIDIEGFKVAKDCNIKLLGSDKMAKFKNKKGHLLIEMPKVTPNELNSKYAYVFKIEGGAKGLK